MWEEERNKMGEGKEQNGRRKGTKWERKRNKKEKESNTIQAKKAKYLDSGKGFVVGKVFDMLKYYIIHYLAMKMMIKTKSIIEAKNFLVKTQNSIKPWLKKLFKVNPCIYKQNTVV